MVVDLRSEKSTFGTEASVEWNKKKEENEKEESLMQVDDFLRESIEILETNF